MAATTEEADQEQLTIRVGGLGHTLTLDIPSTTTIGDIKVKVERQCSLPAGYQKLVARGKRLDDDDATLETLGIRNRSRIMLLHNESYATDREGVLAITSLVQEIEDLSAKANLLSPKTVHELVTQICCKLDGVDTQGSEKLRAMRKQAIGKAEAIDNKSNYGSGVE
mmetsp:Transcript_29849/g.45774  ORF Transcript_29849/g.45774 Transcript_29849/m.45774 type:complete len:167 (-) Transcript_29849:395-895(-)|eukprot:CAMPEP_0195296344 /NCGR_PEP_ID=MMETSP0707-20130614/19241_1 /TAXON_ID=33640 /ORGANISM="Asterionellopsis glacialis, Strain CCMP134" /LENGTH=166 /DNA_ID=CAMNT_0040357823 /DNA_START=24 /DNA_END=524 /DNA_ORIENTATION=-